MVKVSDFISFLKAVSAYDDFVKTVRTQGIPSLRIGTFDGSDEEMLDILWKKVTLTFSPAEIIKTSFAWSETEDETRWAMLHLLWKAKCMTLSPKQGIETTLENIKNYFREKDLLEDIESYQRNSMEKRKNMLPEGISLEKIQIEAIKINPKIFLAGTFAFDETENPDKWREINEEFEDWVDKTL